MSESPLTRLSRRIASLRVTLAGFALLGVAAYAVAAGAAQGRWLIAAPLFLLSLNLLAALLTCRCFRRQPSLFAFHVCLLLLAVLLGVGQLTRLTGHFEIAEGQGFDPASVAIDSRGEWNPGLPAGSAFRQGPIQVAYDPGLLRRGTSSRVFLSGDGQGRPVDVADAKPLVLDGYRFYATHNKGFSALLSWRSDAGKLLRGTVHFPSYPRLALGQVLEWRTPHGTSVELRLEPDPLPQDGWILRAQRAGGRLGVRTRDGEDQFLQPGQSLALPGGVLRLEGFGMWMGYRVFYDPTLPWIFACALLAVSMLAWYFWSRRELPLPGFAPAALTLQRTRA